ncbi:uncharacterized protein LOC118412856 [Branchiostoma floridae]|uniref:Uncharacterized protein LOC118412856 n=1 Tax=Branchiostoma floridae TaxID=7739 RepID=A0A9J7MLN1_BRAFL|nr:uncharacterized protein LOC118412856 [Branchiostoma floridae]
MGTCASVKASQVHEAEEDLYKWTEQKLSMKTGDVQRALICSDAVYLSDLPNTDAIQQFLKEERNLHNFKRVSVSRYGSVRYLLAETQDKEEVFVAFKGTTDFQDVMANLNIWQSASSQSRANHNTGVGGKYHAGFMHLAFLVPANRILEEYSNSRIVVCGHSLGGAVAHIVALNMMACLLNKGKPVDNVKSIAFGAPYIGNDGAHQFAEEYNLSPHLLTIVNEKDPVPYILRLAETVQCAGKTVLKKVENFSSTAAPIVLGILASLTGLGILGASTAVASAVTASTIPAQLGKCEGMLKKWGLLARDLDSLYVPLGWYLYISCSTSKAGGGGHWRHKLLENPGAIEYVRPDIRDWKDEDFQCHRVSNYRTTFFKVAKRTTYRAGDVIIADATFPASIKSFSVLAKDDTDDTRETKTCQIEIKGDNLEFLAEDDPVSGLPVPDGKFAVLFISNNLVALQCELQTDSLSTMEATIRTHFEEVKVSKELVDIKVVPELPYKEEGLVRQVNEEATEGPTVGSVLYDAGTVVVQGAVSVWTTVKGGLGY